MRKDTIRRIVIRAPNWIGDAVMSEPTVSMVRTLFPQAEVTLLAKPIIAELFAQHPGLHRILVYDDRGRHAGLSGKWTLARVLRRHRFDLAILLQNAFEAAFLAFLSDELMPFVEQRFRTTDERSIAGYSFGGLFALYTLFTRPGLFRRYLACSPSVWWGGGMIADIERAYAADHADLPAWLWMATGSEEGEDMTVPMLDLAATLTGREYPSLLVTASVMPGEEHLSAFPPFISRALRAAFTKL